MTIHKKIVQVLRGVAAVQKKRAANGFKFRSIDDVLEALHPEIESAGIYIYPSKVRNYELTGRTSKSGNPVMQCNFVQEFQVVDADSGDAIAIEVVAEGVDATAGDKATEIARSYAFKAALSQLFFIVCKEIEQPNYAEAALPPSALAQKNTQEQKPAQLPQRSETIVPSSQEKLLFSAVSIAEKKYFATMIRDALVARGQTASDDKVRKIHAKVNGKCTVDELQQKLAEAVEELFCEERLQTAMT